MNFTFRLTTLVLIYLTIIGTCGVQQSHSDEQSHQHIAAAVMVNVTEAPIYYLKTDHSDTSCPAYLACSLLGASCLNCNLNDSCIYGHKYNVTCTPKYSCIGERILEKTMVCRYCYQTEHWEHTCILKANCNSVASPKAYYRSNCSVKDDVICLGRRKFLKNLPCNWTGGYRWSTALALSITLGGFGADRFYLGHWQEGIGKLFSFGGLGVWTLIDVILIAIHYLGPADGSLYL